MQLACSTQFISSSKCRIHFYKRGGIYSIGWLFICWQLFTLLSLQTELLVVPQHQEAGLRMVLAFCGCWEGSPLVGTVLHLWVRGGQGPVPAELRDGTSSSAAPSSAGRSPNGPPRCDRPQSSPNGRSSPSVWQDLYEGPPPGGRSKTIKQTIGTLAHLLFELGETSSVKADPFCCVTHSCVPATQVSTHSRRNMWTFEQKERKMNLLKEGSKNHEKAKGKVDVQCLHVGYLWQSPAKQVFEDIIDF